MGDWVELLESGGLFAIVVIEGAVIAILFRMFVAAKDEQTKQYKEWLLRQEEMLATIDRTSTCLLTVTRVLESIVTVVAHGNNPEADEDAEA